jgi:hypothetical protein
VERRGFSPPASREVLPKAARAGGLKARRSTERDVNLTKKVKFDTSRGVIRSYIWTRSRTSVEPPRAHIGETIVTRCVVLLVTEANAHSLSPGVTGATSTRRRSPVSTMSASRLSSMKLGANSNPS